MNSIKYFLLLLSLNCHVITACAQVDTTLIFNTSMAYGVLDIRVAKSPTDYYYLDEGKTFGYRENAGIKTNSFLDMTAWNSEEYEQGNLREKTPEDDLFVMNYRILKPSAYNAAYVDGYPLVILLHGMLERGNCADGKCYHGTVLWSPNANTPPAPTAPGHELLNNDFQLIHGGLNYLNAHAMSGDALPNDPNLSAGAFPGFVIMPQNLNGWREESVEDAIRLVRLIERKYNIDKNRIYINGISAGGHGAYEAMKRAPWLFAAGVLFSAIDDATVSNKNSVASISGIPLWLFQGAKDQKPLPQRTEDYVRKFRDAGANVRYTLYHDLGHGTWNKAFDEPDFFSWMLRQRKNNIKVHGGNAVICKTSGEGAHLSLPSGYTTYEWEFNGNVIDSAALPVYTATQTGTYRGRFMIQRLNGETEWNSWSDVVTVTEKNPSAVNIELIGTALLKDPNGNNEARLRATENYAHYYWYKNGTLINFPGDQDDTINFTTIQSGLGDGPYTLQASDFDQCKTPRSKPIHIIFDDRAPLNISPPYNFKAMSISPSQVKLTWRNSSNSISTEVWRRRNDKNNNEPWQLTTTTPPEITQFTDVNLLPASTYQYIIRSITETERSVYIPEEQQPMILTTMPDTEPPSIPLDLRATLVGINKVRLSWKSSSDNSAIKAYLILFNNDTLMATAKDTATIIDGLSINTGYTFKMVASDMGNNISDVSNEASVNTAMKGLFYEHSTGAWDNLENINWTQAEFTGMVENFILTPKTQDDFFNFRFDGYLYLQKEGVYQFRISSDDGSRLSLDDSLFINNDGIHNLVSVTSPVHIMQSGAHRITVDFFEYNKTDSLRVEYKGPDTQSAWSTIPSEALRSSSTEEVNDGRDMDVIIYPNPVHRVINIAFKNITDDIIKIEILDLIGKIHYQTKWILSDTIRSIHFDDPFESGIFIIKVSGNSFTKCKKIIISD